MAKKAAVITTEEIRAGLLKTCARVDAWYIEYESDRSGANTSPPGSYVHRIVAARRPDKLYHWSTHGADGLAWRDDPFQQRLIISGISGVIEHPFNRVFSQFQQKAGIPLPGTAPLEFVFTALGWWSLDNWLPPSTDSLGEAPTALIAIAKSPRYSVSRFQEMVDNHWCYVFQFPGHDRLWIDCDRGCAVLAREIYSEEGGQLLQRVESNGFHEVLPAIWAPSGFRNILFASEGGKSTKILEANTRVLGVHFNNDVPADLFNFKQAPGSLFLRDNGNYEQSMPGGEEQLDYFANQISASAKPGFKFDNPKLQTIEACIEISIIVACFAFLFRRLSRCQEVKRPDGAA